MDDSRLAATQRELWQLITAPEGVASGLATRSGAKTEGLGGRLRGGASLSAEVSLEVYANAYFHRILDCLIGDYPALRTAIGDAGFNDLVTAYLITHPPDHPSLRFVGSLLPDFLASGIGAGPFRRRWPWAADLGTLEWALVGAFDAPDAPIATREHLMSTAPEDWETLELAMHPATSLLTLSWPVHRLREAYESGEEELAPSLAAERTHVYVWRRRERVFFRALEPQEAEALERVRSGVAFGSLCALLARDRSDEAAATLAAAFLERWLEEGLLASL